MQTSTIPGVVLALVAGACSLASAPASATFEMTNASGTCQGALPQFAGTLRARPMALGNEGSSQAFVSCSIPAGDADNASKKITMVIVKVKNYGSASATLNCTLVDGYADTANYLAKSAPLAAGASGEIFWASNELPQAPDRFKTPNVSCSLPAGTAIYWVGHYFTPPAG